MSYNQLFHLRFMRCFLLLLVVISFTSAEAQEILATTNAGELVRIDLIGGTAQLIGDAGTIDPGGEDAREAGWSGLAFDQAGNLFVVSRTNSELNTGCPVSPVLNFCSHLYHVDPNNGALLGEIGNTQVPWVSDIDFASNGTLYGSQWDGRGALVSIDPATSATNIVGHFGIALSGLALENGGLSVHPTTGEIWAVESSYSDQQQIFRVDPITGAAINPVVRLGLNGSPTDFGLDSLEILPDGRFIATRGGRSSEVYEINPLPNATSGLAELTLIPLTLDPAIAGDLNGLESVTAGVVEISVDIKPGSDPNSINLCASGGVPVAILGSDTFDVYAVETETLRFSEAAVKVVGKKDPHSVCSYEDVNDDSLTDLVCHYVTTDIAGVDGESTSATVKGELLDGTAIEGTDSVNIVKDTCN